MRSDEQGNVGLLLVVGQPVVVVMVVVVMAVLVRTFSRDTLTLGKAGQLQRLAVISPRTAASSS